MAAPKNETGFKLPLETKQKLQATLPDLKKAKAGLEQLKKLGMDTKKLDEMIQYAEEMGEVLLKDFS